MIDIVFLSLLQVDGDSGRGGGNLKRNDRRATRRPCIDPVRIPQERLQPRPRVRRIRAGDRA